MIFLCILLGGMIFYFLWEIAKIFFPPNSITELIKNESEEPEESEEW